jgi:DNA-binding response OmpR family regulator
MHRILVVEDDPDLRELLTYELVHEGFAVDAAELGAEALRVCQRRAPDLVLLDLMLPDYSGIEICQALRRSPETQDVPIVFLTACGSESERIRGLEVGADDYVSKPFSMRELVLRIQALLKRRSAAAVASAASAAIPPMSPISPTRVYHRELLRVWEGFAGNHMRRSEWREAREIWRAILARFEGDLASGEVMLIQGRIQDCDRALSDRTTTAGDSQRRA